MYLQSSIVRQRLLSRLRVRHLQALVKVAELGTVRRAADALGLTQPAVTNLIADLETLVGSPLFLRHARGMRATALAVQWLPVARRMLCAVDDAAERTSAASARNRGVVRVAAIGGAIAGLLVRAIPSFARSNPDILVQLVEADPARITSLIPRGDVDLALCRVPEVPPAGWRFVPLLADRFVVVAGPAHRLARARGVRVDDLKGETWLALPADSAARDAFDRLFGDDPPPIRQVSARVPALLWAMLQAEPLVTIVPASVADQLVAARQLVALRLEHEMPIAPIGMLRPDEAVSEAAQRFADYLEAIRP